MLPLSLPWQNHFANEVSQNALLELLCPACCVSESQWRQEVSVSFVGRCVVWIGPTKLANQSFEYRQGSFFQVTRIIMSSSGEERTNGHHQHSRHMFIPDLLILLSDFMAKDVTLRYVRCCMSCTWGGICILTCETFQLRRFYGTKLTIPCIV